MYYLPSVEIETLTVGAEIALSLHYFHLRHFCLVVISSFAECVLIVYFDLYLNTPVKQKGRISILNFKLIQAYYYQRILLTD